MKHFEFHTPPQALLGLVAELHAIQVAVVSVWIYLTRYPKRPLK